MGTDTAIPIHSVTAPLALRLGDGTEKLVAACFPHPKGLLYLDLFWHQASPVEAAHLIHGELRGSGPWRVGDAVIRVLGCQHTDPQLQPDFQRWNTYLQNQIDEYPPRPQILEIARRLGASV